MATVGGVGPQNPAQTYGIDDILKFTQPKQPSGFRRFMGAVTGGVANMFMPGIGGMIGNFIGGGGITGIGGNTLGGEAGQFLALQQSMQQESRIFEAASAVMRCRHDACMAAIRNLR